MTRKLKLWQRSSRLCRFGRVCVVSGIEVCSSNNIMTFTIAPLPSFSDNTIELEKKKMCTYTKSVSQPS
jgi:hypothetical protein